MAKDVFTLEAWKRTANGTPITLYASADLNELMRERPIILMGGIHGDEPEGVRLAHDTLAWLKECVRNGTPTAPWICIPCLNVDGFAKGTRVNGRGVDLNRNYPSKDWSPDYTQDRYYPGPSPASEPEIQGVVELIEKFKPRLVVHCHSWNPCIVAAGDRARKDAKRLSESSGYEYREEIGYPTPGSLSRYGWHDKQIPIICIEEKDGLEDHSTIWPRFEKGMKSIFQDLSLRDEPVADEDGGLKE